MNEYSFEVSCGAREIHLGEWQDTQTAIFLCAVL
jgi:hypothetical protein